MGREVCESHPRIEGVELKSVLVTGATGFVGRHVVTALLGRGHSVSVLVRNIARLEGMPWKHDVSIIECNIYEDSGLHDLLLAKPPDVLIHLAWAGLPNYRALFHLTENLPNEIRFLQAMVMWGVCHIMIAGTCLEYGTQYGPLEEDQDTRPNTAYGTAKDCIRRVMELMQAENHFVLQWMRLFYMFGDGQPEHSLLPQLKRAIANGERSFPMSPGDQLRDYLPISEVAERFVCIMEHPEINGIINCCSGKPISISDLVQSVIQSSGHNIQLNRGAYPYPSYEALAFWGVPKKLRKIGFN